jgi:Na+/H+ antiporter NhaD/arsenite permease-like protein
MDSVRNTISNSSCIVSGAGCHRNTFISRSLAMVIPSDSTILVSALMLQYFLLKATWPQICEHSNSKDFHIPLHLQCIEGVMPRHMALTFQAFFWVKMNEDSTHMS